MKFELVTKIFIMSLRPYKKYECLDLVIFEYFIIKIVDMKL